MANSPWAEVSEPAQDSGFAEIAEPVQDSGFVEIAEVAQDSKFLPVRGFGYGIFGWLTFGVALPNEGFF